MFTNPATWMALLNAVAGIGAALQGSGVINLIPPNWGAPILSVIVGVNAVAHAFAPATPGPLSGGSK